MILKKLFRRFRAGNPEPGPAPVDSDYRQRVSKELEIFQEQVDVNALPEIFHYWSNKYLRPMLEAYGYSHPDAFFAHYIRQCVAGSEEVGTIISLGSGNCDTEVRVARILFDQGVRNFRIQCLDMNPAMLQRGRDYAASEGLEAHVVTRVTDLNCWRQDEPVAGVMANQSLHHFVALESIFDEVARILPPEGRFIISDMIGRNGHQRWPEALEIVREFWRELPPEYRYNLQLQRQEEVYMDWDCSTEGFEGIRAQDILPLLLERFHFHAFIGFGNVIDPFIDRGFGHHFDAESPRDRGFIDRVHAADEAAILSGQITPTHMMAVLGIGTHSLTTEFSRGLAPDQCIRPPARIVPVTLCRPNLCPAAQAPDART